MADIKKEFISILSNLTIGKHIATPTAAVNFLLDNSSLEKDLYQCISPEIDKPGGTQHKVACLDFLLRLALESEKQANEKNVTYHLWTKRDFPKFYIKILETTSLSPDSDATTSLSVLTRFTDNVRRLLAYYKRRRVLTDFQYDEFRELLLTKDKTIADGLNAKLKENKEEEVSKAVYSGEKRKFKEEVEDQCHDQDQDQDQDQDPAFASHHARQAINQDVARKKQREENENENEELIRETTNPVGSSMVKTEENILIKTGDKALVKTEEQVIFKTENKTAAKSSSTLRDTKEPLDLGKETQQSTEESFSKAFSQTQVIDENPAVEDRKETKPKNEKTEVEKKPETKDPKRLTSESGDREDIPKEYATLTLIASAMRPEEFQHRMNEDRDRCKKHKEHIWEIDYSSFGKFIEFENLWSTTPSSLRQHPEAAAVAGTEEEEYHNRPRHRSDQKKKVKPRTEVIKRNILTALDYERMAEENKISQQALADDPLFYPK
ncbi:uncharacterized protein SAPINGB_P006143 [Magnusiomyces paraingens]|uniref:CID domain-containing protein n=1 Tax=Magnusiomyces paraingens TaxID=2606893 RepID=A0A5E8C4N0_9ASCO|nr:uncharacterized protein SAPINGB_P006143 [Saprochaete ingens]VVT58312.1 unnamed protein product [Saprochaete ingens]